MIGNLKNVGLFQSMFKATADGVLVVSNDGTILMANPACKNLFGYNADTLLAKNIDILIVETYRTELKKHILNLKNTTPCKHLDVTGIKNDTTQFSLEIKLNTTVINGKNVGIVFLRDTSNHTDNLLKIKQTNKALLESNRKYDALINNLQGIVYRSKNDRDWTMEYISQGCHKITGYTAKEFLNGTVHFSHITFKEDQEQVWTATQEGINNKTPFNLNFRIRDKTGNIKYLQELGQGIFDDNGNLDAIEGFITDVTLQKELEFNLIANKAKTKALLEAIPDMMFIQDYEGNYLDFYAPKAALLIVPPNTVIGKNMKDVLPPHTHKKLLETLQKTAETKQIQLVEYQLKVKDSIKCFEARIAPLNNDSVLSIVRDVTANKAQEALLKIRNNALASADNSILIADAKQRGTPIVYCNNAFVKLTGYTKEEVYGKNCNFLQDDDRDQKEITIIKNAIKKGKSCKVILRNYKKDGSLFWNEIVITPVHNEDKELTHFIGVQNDVSYRIKEEQFKSQIRNVLELITKDKALKSIGNTIIETVESHIENSKASILLLNKETKSLYKLCAPNLPKEVSQFIEGVTIGPSVGSCGTAAFFKKQVIVDDIKNNKLWEDYKVIPLKNGLKSCWSFPIMSSKNFVLGVFAIYTNSKRKPSDKEMDIILDMTYLASVAIEKQQNTNALKQSKKQLEQYAQKLEEKVQERTQEVMATVQKLVESNLNLEDQILITKQAEGEALTSKALTAAVAKNFPKGFIAVMDKDLQLVLAEGEALEQLGLKPLLFDGMTIDDVSVFAEERKTRIKTDILKTLSGEHLSFEIEYKNRYFSVNTAPLFDENNQIINALMVYNDISEQKEIEFNIQNALKKEQELNQLKSRFVSMASHEFRTPLSAILTSAILIGKQNEAGKELKREKYVSQIEKNVKHLVNILNDFLSLSKLEEGKIKLTLERVDLVSFSRLVINEISTTLKEGQTIDFKSDTNTLFTNVDQKLFRHIITNILSNASKYSEENKQISFRLFQNKNKVTIQIKDQGIGIPKEEERHLFKRFFRAKNVVNIEGTGLGLNIAKHYTELMGGSIGCKSLLNVGTTFWVDLPVDNRDES
ncbi:PAS domain S-box protein [uncultured Winogradskyella sp.]|uniref:PAS domain S-box protein n=1 Tax=uncultured Winogradskyella sp. TaxID=395353 RepID=UPI0030DD0E29|tara:strand:+ start:10812 stop:14090 length:3279 start_codon:yes stop_codon:yes gene_type:complete